jgi:hypothetical protein
MSRNLQAAFLQKHGLCSSAVLVALAMHVECIAKNISVARESSLG